MLEKILESPLGSKEIKSVNPKGNQPWITHWKDWCWSWSSNTLATWFNSQLIGKDPDARNDRNQKEKRTARVRWLDVFTFSMNMNFHKLREMVRNRKAWRAVVHGVTKSQIQLSDWTLLYITIWVRVSQFINPCTNKIDA